MKSVISTIAGAIVLSAVGAHAATLDGDTITTEYFSPNIGNLLNSENIVAGAGVEVQCPTSAFCSIFAGTVSLDFAGDQILFTQTFPGSSGAYNSGTFNGWVFSDIDFGTGITGVSIASTGFSNPLEPLLTFTSDSITFNLQGQPVDPVNSWTLTLETAPVPLPASGVLLALGVGGFAALRRRKR